MRPATVAGVRGLRAALTTTVCRQSAPYSVGSATASPNADEVVDRFGGPVRHHRLVPDDDLVTPADDGAAQGADLGRAGLVLEILATLVDELAGQEQLVD